MFDNIAIINNNSVWLRPYHDEPTDFVCFLENILALDRLNHLISLIMTDRRDVTSCMGGPRYLHCNSHKTTHFNSQNFFHLPNMTENFRNAFYKNIHIVLDDQFLLQKQFEETFSLELGDDDCLYKHSSHSPLIHDTLETFLQFFTSESCFSTLQHSPGMISYLNITASTSFPPPTFVQLMCFW